MKDLKNKIGYFVIKALKKAKIDIGLVAIKGEHFKFGIKDGIEEGTEAFKKIQYAIQEFVKQGKRDLLDLYIEDGLILNPQMGHNLIATVGRTVLARLLAGDTTYSGEINYGAVGDGTTAFTNASSQLNNEIFRKIPSSQSYDNNITYIDFFIASGDTPNDTFEEWGTFIDGTASADSGQAFSLFLTGGWVKSGSIYISSKYTIN